MFTSPNALPTSALAQQSNSQCMVNSKEPNITSMMKEERNFPPPEAMQQRVHISSVEAYEKLYKQSIDDPDTFWLEQADTLSWFKKPTVARKHSWSFKKRHIEHTWFEDGTLNVNCLDRHIEAGHADRPALIWQGEAEEETKTYTYGMLHEEVCRFANVLKNLGVVKGDRVCLYMPMVPELAIAMLACTRIGAIHSVVFGGFSAEAIADRIGTAEVESALVSHEHVAEAAVAPMPHDIKGQALYAFVTLVDGVKQDGDELVQILRQHVRKQIGPIAVPDRIQFAPALPKTRSGKIMRRILRKIAENDVAAIGDTSTLADPSVVDALVKGADL